MTNKKFRDDLAKEMRDKYNERNEKLEQAEKSSFSDGLKEQMKKEIMDNFDQEMEEMKSRPGYEEARKTHLEEIKARIKLAKSKQEKERLQKEYEEKLAKADEDIAESRKGYEDAQIAHRGKIEDDGNISENGEIPQNLKDFREEWEKLIELDGNTKEKIINAVKGISHRAKIEPDGSMLVEFELGGKKYKVLDVNIMNHTDNEYLVSSDYSRKHKKEVSLESMLGDRVENWKNKRLKEYVQQKQKEGLHIPSEDEMRNFLGELGNSAGLNNDSERIAMLMYLTGIYGLYWGTMINSKNSAHKVASRSKLQCFSFDRYFIHEDKIMNSASLYMMSCE